ncbi:hypothetical protein QOT17_004664 [Balamuthia mandrillaris]
MSWPHPPSKQTLLVYEGERNEHQQSTQRYLVGSSCPPPTRNITCIVKQSVEKLLAAGATRVQLFGSAVWNPNPGDIDFVVSGLDEERCFVLWLDLEQTFDFLFDCLRVEEVVGSSLEEAIQKYGMDVTNPKGLTLPKRTYSQVQFRDEFAAEIQKSNFERVFRDGNAATKWRLFKNLLDFCTVKFRWHSPTATEIAPAKQHHKALLSLFRDALRPKALDMLHTLRKARNNEVYRHQKRRFSEASLLELLDIITNDLEVFVGNSLIAKKWPPPAPEGVAQPLTEWKNNQVSKIEKKYSEKALKMVEAVRAGLEAERDELKAELEAERDELKAELEAERDELKAGLEAERQEKRHLMEKLSKLNARRSKRKRSKNQQNAEIKTAPPARGQRPKENYMTPGINVASKVTGQAFLQSMLFGALVLVLVYLLLMLK